MSQADPTNTLYFSAPHAEKPADALLQAANALSFIGAAVQDEQALASADARAGFSLLLAATEHTIRQVAAMMAGP